MFILAADIPSTLLFPQLTCAVYIPDVNGAGALAGFLVGLVLRIGGGEPLIDLPPFIHYPWYSLEDGQLFPYKTFTMMVSFMVIVSVSQIMTFLAKKNVIPSQMISWKSQDKYSIQLEETSEVKNLAET